jgi:hypothetical protein
VFFPPSLYGDFFGTCFGFFFVLNIEQMELTSYILVGCVLVGRFISSVSSATLVVSITGFSWAVSHWAPFSLVRPFPFPSLPKLIFTHLVARGSHPLRPREHRLGLGGGGVDTDTDKAFAKLVEAS